MTVLTSLKKIGQKGSEKFEIAQILQTLRYSEESRAISPTSSVDQSINLDQVCISCERDVETNKLKKIKLSDGAIKPFDKLDPMKIPIQPQTVVRNCNHEQNDQQKKNVFSPLAAPPQMVFYTPNQKTNQTSTKPVSLVSSHYSPVTSGNGAPRITRPLRNEHQFKSSLVTDSQSKNTIIAPILLLPSTYGLLTNKSSQVPQSYEQIIESYTNLDKKIEFLIKAYQNENSIKRYGNSGLPSTEHQLINLENLREALLRKATPLTQQHNMNLSSAQKEILKKNAQGKQESGKNRKICRMDSCEAPAARRTPYCIKHSGPRKCEFDGCTKCAQGRTRFCIAHGGGRRCIYPGCSKGARDRKYCASHGGGRRCVVEYCYKLAVGGCNTCTAHGGGKRCKFEGCSKSAQSSSSYCVRHGGGRKCSFPRCTKVARGKSRLCMSHSTQLVKANQDQDSNYTLLNPLCQFVASEKTMN